MQTTPKRKKDGFRRVVRELAKQEPTTYHVCVPIDVALQKLQRGVNIFDGTPLEAFHSLMTAKERGHTYYTGCNNVDREGRCKGHLTKDRK